MPSRSPCRHCRAQAAIAPSGLCDACRRHNLIGDLAELLIYIGTLSPRAMLVGLDGWVILMTPDTWQKVRQAFLDLDWPFGNAALYREAAALCAYLAETRAIPPGRPS